MNPLQAWAGLELRHLRALEAIAEQGSFHRAATHLGYSQSAVSQQIAGLERVIGVRVIERMAGSRPVELTDAGRVLLEHGRLVFAQVSAAHHELTAGTGRRPAPLRVGAFQSVGAHLIPQLLERARHKETGLKIELTQTTSDPELLALLRTDELDITFAMLPVPDGPFTVRELFADKFVGLVATDSEFAPDGRVPSIDALATQPLITAATCRTAARIEAQMHERGLQPRVAHRSDDNGTVRALAAAGAGVAIVPRLSAGTAGDGVRVLSLDEDLPPRRIALCWRSDRPVAAAHGAFVAEVIAVGREAGLIPAAPPATLLTAATGAAA